jgi:hypothetical protein
MDAAIYCCWMDGWRSVFQKYKRTHSLTEKQKQKRNLLTIPAARFPCFCAARVVCLLSLLWYLHTAHVAAAEAVHHAKRQREGKREREGERERERERVSVGRKRRNVARKKN